MQASTPKNFTARDRAVERDSPQAGHLGMARLRLRPGRADHGRKGHRAEGHLAVDSFSRESQQAERALTDAGLRPNEEVVLIQSETRRPTTPRSRPMVDETAAELEATEARHQRRHPRRGRRARSPMTAIRYWSTSRSPATDLDGGDNVVASRGARRVAAERRTPSSTSSSSVPARPRRRPGHVREPTSARPGCSPCRSRCSSSLVALGALVAAGVPLLLALTAVLATMALVAIPSQIFPLDGNVGALILLIGLAVGVDYSLFYMRREREERAAGRARRSRCRPLRRPQVAQY